MHVHSHKILDYLVAVKMESILITIVKTMNYIKPKSKSVWLCITLQALHFYGCYVY